MNTNMPVILRFWRDKTKIQKQEIMSKYGIKTMTYEQIKMIYNENTKK